MMSTSCAKFSTGRENCETRLAFQCFHGGQRVRVLQLVRLADLLPRRREVGLHHLLHVISHRHLNILQLQTTTTLFLRFALLRVHCSEKGK